MQHFALCLASRAQVVDSKTRDFGAEVAFTGIENNSAVIWVSHIVRRVTLKPKTFEIGQENWPGQLLQSSQHDWSK
jgi:hypothetical protein